MLNACCEGGPFLSTVYHTASRTEKPGPIHLNHFLLITGACGLCVSASWLKDLTERLIFSFNRSSRHHEHSSLHLHPHLHVLVPKVKTLGPAVSRQVYRINTASRRKVQCYGVGDLNRGWSLSDILPSFVTVMDSLGPAASDPEL